MRSRTAFTLIELLVVVAVVAALMGVVLPVTAALRESGRQSHCLSNLAQLGKALHMYADDWNGYIPPYNNLDAVTRPGHDALLARAFAPYVRDPRIWFCPSDPYAGQGRVPGVVDSSFSHRYGSYANAPFIPPVVIEPGHRLMATPWRLDRPGLRGDGDLSNEAYLADWFVYEIFTPDRHNGSGNVLAFDGRVVAGRKRK
jgi:prepilin-type N-terminal cleavage/methylation domain-containing protein/prepilin-type processing-associated H-X9-DG protein